MCDNLAVAHAGAAGAPAEKVEVTPGMVAAGSAVIFDALYHDPLMSPGLAESLAEEVLRAAESKRPPKTHSDHWSVS
jgi:hypothetical protein